MRNQGTSVCGESGGLVSGLLGGCGRSQEGGAVVTAHRKLDDQPAQAQAGASRSLPFKNGWS